MNKILLFTIGSILSTITFGQGQIGNADLELWEGVASGFEPVNWNSFLSAQGDFAGFAGDQITESSDTRPGSAGFSSARIWTRDAGFGVKANGNMTLGRINMGSITPSNTSNHNVSLTADPIFSEALTDTPDSIVFWVKYNAANSTSEARMKATLHDSYDYTDPETGVSADHVFATAILNYSPTGWTRMAIGFNYSGPAISNTFILLTFATNAIPGGGDVDDEVWIDDVELIYNPVGLDEFSNSNTNVSMDNDNNIINVSSTLPLNSMYEIYDMQGKVVQSGVLTNSISFEHIAGMYIVVPDLKIKIQISRY